MSTILNTKGLNMEDCVMSIDDLGKLPFDAVVPLAKRMAVGSPPDWGGARSGWA
jgi:hypothetical protein